MNHACRCSSHHFHYQRNHFPKMMMMTTNRWKNWNSRCRYYHRWCCYCSMILNPTLSHHFWCRKIGLVSRLPHRHHRLYHISTSLHHLPTPLLPHSSPQKSVLPHLNTLLLSVCLQHLHQHYSFYISFSSIQTKEKCKIVKNERLRKKRR